MFSIFKKNIESYNLENAIALTVITLVFNIFFPSLDNLILRLVNECLTLAIIFFGAKYSISIIERKHVSPISLILNAGILVVLIFFFSTVSDLVFEGNEEHVFEPIFLYQIITIIINIILVGFCLYIFAVLRELFYSRQKNDPKQYFRTMLLFFLLTFLARILVSIDVEYEYLENAFFVVSIILIVLNSMRVAWIAFLTKKQKLFLLAISVVLTLLFGVNFFLSQNENYLISKIVEFSFGLPVLFDLLMLFGAIYFGVVFFTSLFHLPTAEAMDRKADELSSLMGLSKLLTQVFDIKELGENLSQTTRRVCNANSSWLVIKNGEEFKVEITNNIGLVDADNLSTRILKRNSKIEEILIFDEKSLGEAISSLGITSIAAVPLKIHNKVNGFLFAARKSLMQFDDEEIRSLTALSHYGAIAIENAKLFEESIVKERLEKELDVAREIQYKILPTEIPQIENVDISALFIPAFEVGGDYYDFFEMGNNKLGFVIADVSGKGISAAFIMAEVKGVFESLSLLLNNPAEILIKANDSFMKSFDKKSFVTAIYGIIDTTTGKMVVSRAGHPPLILKRGNNLEEISPRGIGLGLSRGEKFDNNIEQTELDLISDDTVILYTDGIPEAQNNHLESFGFERLEKIIKDHNGKDINDLSNEIVKDVTVFAKDKSQHDDITLVIFKWVKKNKTEY